MDIVDILSLIVIFLLGILVIGLTAFVPDYLEKKMNRELKKEAEQLDN